MLINATLFFRSQSIYVLKKSNPKTPLKYEKAIIPFRTCLPTVRII